MRALLLRVICSAIIAAAQHYRTIRWRTLGVVLSLFLLSALVGRSLCHDQAEPGCTADQRLLVDCLMSVQWVRDALNQVGYKAGDAALVRCTDKPIRGLSPPDQGQTKVALYSQRQDRAVLFSLERRGAKTVPLRNAYFLAKERSTWVASEGNGGLATYRAVGAFGTTLAQRSPIRVVLATSSSHPCTEDK